MFEIFLIFFIFQVRISQFLNCFNAIACGISIPFDFLDSDVSVCIRRLASNLTKLKYICQTYIKCSY